METNMNGVKRRLNKAIGDYKTQASFTARKLVGQTIRTLDRRTRGSSLVRLVSTGGRQRRTGNGSQEESDRTGSGRHARQSPTRASGEQARNAKRQFKYTFTPNKQEDRNCGGGEWRQVELFSQLSDNSNQFQEEDPKENRRQQQKAPSPVKLKTSLQRFVRYSALAGSSRRRASGRRRRSGRQIRQVRFQPVPTSINISGEQPDDEEEEDDDEDLGWGSDFDDEQSLASSSDSSSCSETSKTNAVQLLAASQLNSSSCQAVGSKSCKPTTSKDQDDDSDASTGVGSEHSGSQDSGHSTQHSGYSQAGSCHGEHQLASMESAGSSTALPVSDSPQLAGAETEAEAESPESSELEPAQKSNEEGERRARFLQNRLIINNKLESLFASRSSPPSRELSGASLAQKQEKTHQEETNRKLCAENSSVQAMAAELETRMRLLKQQRQISLKLKQKPRQKNQMRANCLQQQLERQPASSYETTDNDNATIESEKSQDEESFSSKRESLTKQLSMICLRQAGQVCSQPTPSRELTSGFVGCSVQNLQQVSSSAKSSPTKTAISPTRPSPSKSLSLTPARPAAVSLRQLVKEVIDDCERPNQLSSNLLLNKSNESFSSAELLEQHPQQPEVVRLTGSCEISDSCPSLDSSPQQPPLATGHFRWPSPTCIEPTARGCPPVMKLGQQQADLSLTSSLGTIEGLEYSRAGSDCVSPEAAAALPERGNLQRLQKSTFGSYLKSLREFSRFKLPKVKLMAGLNLNHNNNSQTEQGHFNQPAELFPEPSAFEASPARGLPDMAIFSQLPSLAQLHAGSSHLIATQQQHYYQPTGNGQFAPATASRTLAWRSKAKRASIMDLTTSQLQHSQFQDNHQQARLLNQQPGLQSVELTDHFVTISNRKWKSCHLRTSLKCLNNFE